MRLQPQPYHCQSQRSKKIVIDKINVHELRKQYCNDLAKKLANVQQNKGPDTHWKSLRGAIH